jgi:nucleoside 2-deoxyribosyltransferase
MKVYLANFFSKKAQMKACADELSEKGIEVTARWHNETVPHSAQLSDLSDEYHQQIAVADLADIYAADVLVLFTAEEKDYSKIPAKSLARGGRHFESGFALAANKTLIICGPRENVFHYLPQVLQFNSWTEVKSYLCRMHNLEKNGQCSPAS